MRIRKILDRMAADGPRF